MRLRDIAASVGITERSAYAIVTDLTAAGYVVKRKDGRRNRYQVQAYLPLPEPTGRGPAIGEVLALIAGANATEHLSGTEPAEATAPPPEAASPGYRGSQKARPQALGDHHCPHGCWSERCEEIW